MAPSSGANDLLAVTRALAALKSAIKSGEPWTQQLADTHAEGLEAVHRLDSRLDALREFVYLEEYVNADREESESND